MTRTRSLLIATVLAAGTAAGVATVADAPAGAAGASCTAWATLPARVALTDSSTTIRPQLVGTAGCRAGSFDGGATATLREPGRQPYGQRWVHFGDREQVVLYASLNPVGRYTVTDGNVQVYDANEVRVPATWRATATTVRYGARFGSVSVTSSRTRAVLSHYSSSGWRRSVGTPVVLQHRTGQGWTTVARGRTDSQGGVTLKHGARGDYRLESAGNTTVWGATASLDRRA